MRRVLVVLALAASASLTACGGSTPPAPTPSSGTPTASESIAIPAGSRLLGTYTATGGGESIRATWTTTSGFDSAAAFAVPATAVSACGTALRHDLSAHTAWVHLLLSVHVEAPSLVDVTLPNLANGLVGTATPSGLAVATGDARGWVCGSVAGSSDPGWTRRFAPGSTVEVPVWGVVYLGVDGTLPIATSVSAPWALVGEVTTAAAPGSGGTVTAAGPGTRTCSAFATPELFLAATPPASC